MSTNPNPLPAPPRVRAGERPANGCDQLLALLDPAVRAAPLDAAIWPQLNRPMVRWLIHLHPRYPWLNHLTLAGVVYAVSGVTHPESCLYAVHRFLRWAIPEHYPNIAALELERAIREYFGDPPRSRGLTVYKGYHALQLHMERYLAALPPNQQAALQPFLLPRLPYSPPLMQLTKRQQEQTRRNRKEKAFAVVKRFPELVALARQRYRWLAELDTHLQHVIRSVQQSEMALPAVITLPALAAPQELRFRVWDHPSRIAAHAGTYGQQAIGRVQPPGAEDSFFLQLVGDLPDHAWFLRAVAVGALQGNPHRDADARTYLQTWGLHDFNGTPGGLLHASKSMSGMLYRARRAAAGTPDDSAVLFYLAPLLAAAAVGMFVVISIVSTGMRLGELQQLTLDRDCIESLELPAFDDRTARWSPGPRRIYWRLYPKGRNRRERYLVTPYMNEALFALLERHQRASGAEHLPAVPTRTDQFSHARRFPGQHRFVLQWNGQQLGQPALTDCVKFLLLEHICRDQDGTPVNITSHILRHGVAGWLRLKGIPLEEIMTLLKHVNLSVTDYYSQLSPEDLHQKLGPALTALAELAGTEPAAIRTPADLQQVAHTALKQFGALRRIPGGECGTFDPCRVHFACATCRFFVPDPARKAEVEAKLILSEQIATLRRAAGDYIEADNERVHTQEWARILKEMEALELIPLLSSPSPEMLEQLGEHGLDPTFRPVPPPGLGLPAGGAPAHG